MKKSPQHKPECPAKESSIKEHLPPNKKLSDALPALDDSEHCHIKYTRAITKRKKPINSAVKVKFCTNAELVCFLLILTTECNLSNHIVSLHGKAIVSMVKNEIKGFCSHQDM